MKGITFAAVACVLSMAAPGPPARADPTQRARADAQVGLANADAEIVAYGAWMQEVQTMVAPLATAFSSLGERFQAGASRGPGWVERLFADIASAQRLVRAVGEAIRTMRTPQISVLPLADELLPASLQREQVAIIAEMGSVLDHLEGGLRAAGRGDRAEAERAMAAVFDGVRTMIRQRTLFLRAAQATTPREDSAWEFANAEIIIFRAMDRLLLLFAPGTAGDESAARDLTALAAELGVSRGAAMAKMKAEAQEIATDAELVDGSPAGSRLIGRLRSLDEVSGRYLALLAEWEAYLSEAAGQVGARSPPLSERALVTALLPRFRDLRQRSDRLQMEMAEALAAR